MATIVIVGAGFSGSLLAIHLLRKTQAQVVLIDRVGVDGRGLAYGACRLEHRLNVRSGRMSAFADDPTHFLRWLQNRHPDRADPEGFAPRLWFGDYLSDTLDAAQTAANGRLTRIQAEAVAVGLTPDRSGGWGWVDLADGRRIGGCRIALALGNPPPGGAVGQEDLSNDPRYVADPWSRNAIAAIGAAEDVLMIGAGLTMVDVAQSLMMQGWTGRGLALSRRGLLPKPHDQTQAHATARQPPDGKLSDRLKRFRAHADAVGWGRAMDEIRPFNIQAWEAFEQQTRARFLRHLRPWWDVHRHRTAPEAAACIDALRSNGSLKVAAGRIASIRPDRDGLWVHWRPRGARETVQERFDRIIACTGPDGDPLRSGQPFVKSLLQSGLGAACPLGLGLQVSADGRLLDPQGRPSEVFSALGPPTKSAFWEMVAVPELRVQAAQTAERIAKSL